jgi:hypothetical protein
VDIYFAKIDFVDVVDIVEVVDYNYFDSLLSMKIKDFVELVVKILDSDYLLDYLGYNQD